MQFILVLKASQNAAKCETECMYIHCNGIGKIVSKPLKHGLKVAKYPLKSGILGSKSGFLGVNNNGLATNLERLNGTKCRLFLKNGHIGR